MRKKIILTAILVIFISIILFLFKIFPFEPNLFQKISSTNLNLKIATMQVINENNKNIIISLDNEENIHLFVIGQKSKIMTEIKLYKVTPDQITINWVFSNNKGEYSLLGGSVNKNITKIKIKGINENDIEKVDFLGNEIFFTTSKITDFPVDITGTDELGNVLFSSTGINNAPNVKVYVKGD
jgi:hypothetical protein